MLRSRSSPPNGGYNELSSEDRAGQEKIYLRAQRDIEQLILNDSHSVIKNDRFEQVDRNSDSLITGEERHKTQGTRSTLIGADELLTISGNSSTTSAGSLVIHAAQQAHLTATDVVINGDASLTLTAGGYHLVINASGIFSSEPIVVGG
ncbi:type VI secretion system tip protein VgrG, partial [Pseudomonas sp. 14P_8.1_Bac3]|nr:type VI secretion system tip protein VgrG [Pseudomonas sp. 14P_8.1_Bac3]